MNVCRERRRPPLECLRIRARHSLWRYAIVFRLFVYQAV